MPTHRRTSDATASRRGASGHPVVNRFFRLIGCLAALLIVAVSPAWGDEAASGYRVEPAKDGGGWNVMEGDELVAGYRFDSNGKPILFPVHSPDGKPLTRQYPMVEGGENERQDHPHQRSLWLSHGEVDGVDFWAEAPRDECGRIVHRSGSASGDGKAAVIVTENDWVAPDGTKLLSDRRRFAFTNDGDRRILDCDFSLDATEGDVNFGDTKEGSFGIRVAGTMKVDAEMGGKITNAEGKTDKAAWSLPSKWVDYTGPTAGSTAGITAHYHPSSFNFPCRWHVRTYGLFAANPFGVYHFVGGDKTDGHTLPEGESLRMSFRLVLHDGPFDRAEAEKDFEAYRGEDRPNDF